jgi:cytochrome P450
MLMNQELIKETLAAEKVMILHKEKKIAEVFFSIIRKGLVAL